MANAKKRARSEAQRIANRDARLALLQVFLAAWRRDGKGGTDEPRQQNREIPQC